MNFQCILLVLHISNVKELEAEQLKPDVILDLFLSMKSYLIHDGDYHNCRQTKLRRWLCLKYYMNCLQFIAFIKMTTRFLFFWAFNWFSKVPQQWYKLSIYITSKVHIYYLFSSLHSNALTHQLEASLIFFH